jgi:hypothetical protein
MRGPEDGCATIFRNVRKYLQDDASQHPGELDSLNLFLLNSHVICGAHAAARFVGTGDNCLMGAATGV